MHTHNILWCAIVIYIRIVIKIVKAYIKTHGSQSRGQEEAGLRDEPVSYLQVTLL